MKKLLCGISGVAILFSLLFMSVAVTSCTKEVLVHDTTLVTVHDTVTVQKECPAPVYPITGVWIGTYTADLLPNDPPQYFSFIIKPNGELTVESHPQGKYYYGTGTWTLSGNILNCTYLYPTAPQGYSVNQTASAVYDSTSGKLSAGTWQNVGAPNGTGKFTMSRVNK